MTSVLCDPRQPKITKIFDKTDQNSYNLEIALKSNRELRNSLKKEKLNELLEDGFLKNLICQAKKKHKKYDTVMKYVCMHLFLLSGEFLILLNIYSLSIVLLIKQRFL